MSYTVDVEFDYTMFDVDEITQAPRIGEKKVRKIVKDAWGITKCDVEVLNGYEDMNFRLKNCKWEKGSTINDEMVIFKVTNPVAAKDTKHLDFQNLICEALNANGIPAPFYIPLKKSEKIWRLEKITDQAVLPVRLIRVLPGNNLDHFSFTEETIVNVGRIIGELHNILDTIPKHSWESHIPFIAAENVECSIKEVDVLLSAGLLDHERAQLVRKVFDELKDDLLGNSDQMDVGLIHSDVNDTNILAEPVDDTLKITGLIDFGDVHVSLRIMDLGATCLYLALDDRQPDLEWSRFPLWILRGYESVRDCPDAHKIVSAMRARMACSLICGLRAARINYRNEKDSYVLKTQIRGWQLLRDLMVAGPNPLL